MRGHCLCGSVAFEIDGPLPRAYQCHCSLCRKQTGTSSNTSLMIASRHFRWTAGESLVKSYVKASGFRSDFCQRCGSPVPNPLRGTDYLWVPAGLLEGEVAIEIGAHLCVNSKAYWDVLPAGGVRYAGMPENEELLRLLNTPRQTES
ncbi:MAG: GFA family protein [Gammaproteobacteria bacterium]|nr:GFA family protein [Gammaproteobacteria bacterium]